MKLSTAAQQVARDRAAVLIRERKDSPAGELDVKPLFNGNNRGWVVLDATTAQAVNVVFAGLNEANRAKLDATNPAMAIYAVWKMLK